MYTYAQPNTKSFKTPVGISWNEKDRSKALKDA